MKDGEDDAIHTLAADIAHLKILYDKYFAGVDRIEPINARHDVKRLLQQLKQGPQITNTARRFKLQSLQATLVMHEEHWDKICRRIEEGTHKRSRKRAKEGQQEDRPEPLTTPVVASEKSYSSELKKIYAAYVQAQATVGVKPISLESMARTMAQQETALKQRHGCNRVEFQVLIKNGKAFLQAVPKK